MSDLFMSFSYSYQCVEYADLCKLLSGPKTKSSQIWQLLKKIGANIMIPLLVTIWGLVTTFQGTYSHLHEW
jgi:hypothetical protein